jgi:hypothetical protein
LTSSVTSIGAKRVRVDKLADRQPIDNFSNGQLGVVAAGEISRRQRFFPSFVLSCFRAFVLSCFRAPTG